MKDNPVKKYILINIQGKEVEHNKRKKFLNQPKPDPAQTVSSLNYFLK